MAKHYFMARLGGADRKLLADEETTGQSGERTRFVAMAGILLTTASVATVSMFFALHHGVGLSVGWSIPFALAWGVVIINIDRYLVISMSGTRGHKWQMFMMMVPRVLLAALIAIVVATPLVLQIFASDIGAELPILQEQQSKAFAQGIGGTANGQQLAKVQGQIAQEQAVINGSTSQTLINDQSAVTTLTQEADAAAVKAATQKEKYLCEQDGATGAGCPAGTSGQAGNGPRAQGDYAIYLQEEQNATTLNSELQQARTTLLTAQGIASQNKTTAQQKLTNLLAQEKTLQADISAQVNTDNKSNKSDTGLLAQIQALNAASAKNPGLAAAHWIVTALFFVIELLPVVIKCLLLIGPETAYERIVAIRGDAAVEQAGRRTVTEMQIVDVEGRSSLDIAEAEARSRADMRRRRLLAEETIAEGKARVDENAEEDMRIRDEASRKEFNERIAAESKNYVVAMMDEWSRRISERIAQSTQRQSANGQLPPSHQQQYPGYNKPGGSI